MPEVHKVWATTDNRFVAFEDGEIIDLFEVRGSTREEVDRYIDENPGVGIMVYGRRI